MAYSGGQAGWKFSKKVAWDGVSVEGGKTAPEGLYDGKLIKCEPKVSKTDKPMLEAKFELTGAEDQALRDEGVGLFVYDNWVIDEAGGFKMKNFSLVSGVDLPESQAWDDVQAFIDAASGSQVPLMVKHDMYGGKTRAKIAYYGSEEPKDETNGKSKGGSKSRGQPTRGGRR